MKKILLSGFVIVVFVLYAIYHNSTQAPVTSNKNNNTTVSDSAVNSSPTQSSGNI